ncbi:Uncharacterised protein [Segatella copri]|nr:Uncharacterised protein [Segatella copri]
MDSYGRTIRLIVFMLMVTMTKHRCSLMLPLW